jgi:class 3 adenylate cyclase
MGSSLKAGSLGLERYEGAFRENDIDETVLSNLTAEDLKELDVTTIGHRRKLLDTIAALRADASASPTAAPGPAAVETSSWDAAERRQVTVMFSDLVGSTALSASMDAEDLLSEMRRRDRKPFWRLRCEVYGGRCSNLFRLPPGPTRTMPSEPCALGWSW